MGEPIKQLKVRFMRDSGNFKMGEEVSLDAGTAHTLFNYGIVSMLEPEKFNRKEIKKARRERKIAEGNVRVEEKDKPKNNSGPQDILRIDNYLDNAKTFYERQPYFYDQQKIWWLWRYNRWKITDDVDMGKLLDDCLGFMGQTVSSTIRNNHLTAMGWVGRDNRPKDAPIKWIQFKDKAFSIESKNIYDVTHHYFFCNPIPWDIGESDETPVMDKLFEEWVGRDNKQLLYEIIAYCCYPSYPIQTLFCLLGNGRNGKSCFLRLLGNFIGPDNVCCTELDLLVGHNQSRFESVKLYKKLVCQMGETNFGVLSKSSIIKKLTGGDMMGFELKGKNGFDDFNYSKIIIASNSLPSSTDTSEGFYRRWLIIDFPNEFPEGKDIIEKIPDIEYNNLCKKVIGILPGLLKDGFFINQGTIAERKKKYILASNPLSLFIKEHCNKGDNLFMRYSELYTEYIKYLVKLKRRRISKKEFSGVLDEEGFEIIKTTKKIDDEFVGGYFIDGLEMKVKESKNIEEDVEDYPINTKAGKFKEIEPTLRKCVGCDGINTMGWVLEKEDGGVYCDFCAERI